VIYARVQLIDPNLIDVIDDRVWPTLSDATTSRAPNPVVEAVTGVEGGPSYTCNQQPADQRNHPHTNKPSARMR
jgi:hypothetical protein